MTDLRRTPSIQHAVALIRNSVTATVREFERLDEANIPFSLNPGRRMVKPLMEGYSVEWAVRQLQLDRRPKNITPNVGLVQAFAPYAKAKAVSWFRECDMHAYPIGGDVVIPVRPSGFWVEDGKLRVLWPQCWKGRTLDNLQLAIFNTVLRKTFFVGDFRNAKLEWVDLREVTPKSGRSLEVRPGEELGVVSDSDLAEYMDILVKAFQIHRKSKGSRTDAERRSRRGDDRGPSLFDTPGDLPGR